MTTEEVAAKFAELEEKCKSLSRRVGAAEGMQQAIFELAKSMKAIEINQDSIAKQTGAIAKKVEELEKAPGKKWGDVIRTVITALVSAAITFAFTKIFT